MSDSPQEENKPLLSSKDGEKVQPRSSNLNTVQKAALKPDETTTKLPFVLKLIVALAVIALVIFAGVIGSQLLDKPKSEEQISSPTPQPTNEPISILPLEPGGVTILSKQPDTQQPTAELPTAPIAQGADIASGFAMDIGSADSYLDLTRKFAELVEINGAENFLRLEPRAILQDTVSGLEARLLIGPFTTSEQALEACSALILPENTPCTVGSFQGDLISRK